MHKPLIFIFICITHLSFAQNFEAYNISGFHIDGSPLGMHFNGGNNAPQVGKLDIDLDGHEDLYVFDRDGGTHQIYIANNSAPHGYTYIPQYNDRFPICKEFVLLRDYDRDGLKDIFTYSTVPGVPGFQVYHQVIVDGQVSFEFVEFPSETNDLLYANGNEIYVGLTDYPEIKDIDGDGDLDIIAFENSGIHVHYFQNLQVENNLALDALVYTLADDCFGKFIEGDDNQMILSDDIATCASNFSGGIEPRHNGATIMAFDENKDGLFEFLVGDDTHNSLNKLNNGGMPTNTFIVDQDPTFPSYDTPIDVSSLPAGFYVDLDRDNFNDIVIGPNKTIGSYDKNVFHFYKNNGWPNLNHFTYQSDNFLNTSAFDVGSYSKPAFMDIDHDGLMDIIVGNRSTFVPTTDNFNSRLTYLKNVGTQDEPAFQVMDEDYLDAIANNFNKYNLSPTFGDLDGDGDLDLLLGDNAGDLIYIKNIGDQNTTLWDTPVFNFADLSVFGPSMPTIFDVDQDGLNDISIGLNNGTINFYKNIGAIGNPQFSADITASSNIEGLGEVDTRKIGEVNGKCQPKFYLWNNSIELICGSSSGQIFHYKNILNNLDGTFDLVNDNLGQQHSGTNTYFDMVLLDDDNTYDIVIGNSRGGLQFYNSSINIDGTIPTTSPTQTAIRLSPNPAKDAIYLTGSLQYNVRVYNALGQVVLNQEKARHTVDINTLTQGLYYVQVETIDHPLTVFKLVVE